MKKQDGFTYIELLIGIVIVVIVLTSILTSLNFTAIYIQNSTNRVVAQYFNQKLVEEMKDVKYDLLDGYNGYTDNVDIYMKEDISIPGTMAVTVQDNGQYKTITVTTSWVWRGRSNAEEITTIISKHN